MQTMAKMMAEMRDCRLVDCLVQKKAEMKVTMMGFLSVVSLVAQLVEMLEIKMDSLLVQCLAELKDDL